ncbi:MAG: hypothetical protein LBV19_00320 [Streptococcaceae bacterium]|jgi:hypothetical protein|nr:hypothetical protein [Streptococcaceae bacterium]
MKFRPASILTKTASKVKNLNTSVQEILSLSPYQTYDLRDVQPWMGVK